MRSRIAERFHPVELEQARAAAEAQPLQTPQPPRRPYPGVSADVLAELRVEPVRPVRIRLAPVGRVRLDRLKQQRREQTPVSQLCAAAGLVYAKRHIAAEVVPVVGDTAKAQVAL